MSVLLCLSLCVCVALVELMDCAEHDNDFAKLEKQFEAPHGRDLWLTAVPFVLSLSCVEICP
jgi:hypothetical protein